MDVRYFHGECQFREKRILPMNQTKQLDQNEIRFQVKRTLLVVKQSVSYKNLIARIRNNDLVWCVL